MVEEENPIAQLGWRFTAGVVLIVGGYAALGLAPMRARTSLEGTVRGKWVVPVVCAGVSAPC
jgi:hypothetical protein